jgi:hypothetical protein
MKPMMSKNGWINLLMLMKKRRLLTFMYALSAERAPGDIVIASTLTSCEASSIDIARMSSTPPSVSIIT